MEELNPQILEVSDQIRVLQLQLKTNSEGKDALYQSEPISDTWIKISKLTTKEKYKVEKVSDMKLKIEEVNPKAKHQHHPCLCTNFRKSKEIPW